MDIYQTEEGKTYVAVPLTESKEAAITKANSHFRISKSRLGQGYGWIKADTLYFSEVRGAKKCWLFWRKSSKEA